MGRTKKPPVVWQDYHDEGAFRSTWTSQANPELFPKTDDKIPTAKGELLTKREGSDCPKPIGVAVKSEDNVTPETVLKGISMYDNSAIQGAMVSPHLLM